MTERKLREKKTLLELKERLELSRLYFSGNHYYSKEIEIQLIDINSRLKDLASV